MSTALARILIVGNGIAGLTAAETLRSEGFTGEITIVGSEAHAAYSRPALSKSALLEGTEMQSHLLPAPDHGATLMLGHTAAALDLDARTVRLSDGSELGFDGLIIASGSHARRLSASSAEYTLRDLDDATALRQALATRPEVIVIGGGALAMEVASGSAALGCKVTLIARRTPMTALVGPFVAEVLADAAHDAGVTIRMAQEVSVHDAPGGGAAVVLDGETRLQAPVVVTAIGDDANVSWLADSGLLHDGQLRVDTRGRVAPDVVAAGDVAAVPCATGWARIPLWTSAIEQAKVAAKALLHGDAAPELNFQPYFWTEQFGISLKVCGPLPVAGEPENVDGDVTERRALLRWQHADGTATAAALGYRIPVPRLRALTRPVADAA